MPFAVGQYRIPSAFPTLETTWRNLRHENLWTPHWKAKPELIRTYMPWRNCCSASQALPWRQPQKPPCVLRVPVITAVNVAIWDLSLIFMASNRWLNLNWSDWWSLNNTAWHNMTPQRRLYPSIHWARSRITPRPGLQSITGNTPYKRTCIV